MSHIFISYSRKNLTIAEKIIDALAKDDFEPWIDWKSIPKGEQFEHEIHQGIEGADVFLFLVSPDSVQSDWCNKEIDHAVKNGKRILPIVIRETDRKIIHPEISKRNWISCREGQDDINKAIEEIRKTTHTDYEWLKYHTKLQVKALDWEQKKNSSQLLRGRELHEAKQRFAQIGGHEDPQPTKIQHEYILTSQKNEVSIRRLIAIVLTFILMVIVGLSVAALRQESSAIRSQMTAEAEAFAKSTAQAQVARESAAKSTAQANAAEKATIARAVNLVDQSMSLRGSQLDLSLLLGVESFRSVDMAQTRNALLAGLQANPHLLRYLYGHSGPVTSLAYSPDGSILASASEDNIIKLWNVPSYELIGEISIEHANYLNKIVFSHDGGMLAAGDFNGVITLWSLTSRKQIGTSFRIDGFVDQIAFMPDGNKLITGSDSTISIWDVSNQQVVPQIQVGATPGALTSVAVNPDGTLLAYADVDGTIVLWDTETQQKIGKPLIGHTDAIEDMAFSPDGQLLVSGGYDAKIIIWDVQSRQPAGLPIEVNDIVNRVEFSPNGELLASGLYDGSLILWNVSNHQMIGEPILSHKNEINDLAFTPDGKTLATGSYDRSIIVWNVAESQVIEHTLPGNIKNISSVAFSKDGTILASASEDTGVDIWGLENLQQPGKLLTDHANFVKRVLFSPVEDVFASGGWDNKMVFRNLNNDQILYQFQTPSAINGMAFSRDGKILAMGLYDGTILLWCTDTRKVIGQPLRGHTGSVNAVDFSPDGRMVVSGGDDGTLIVWDVTGLQTIGQPLHGHAGQVRSVAFSPDGTVLASSSYDDTVILWDTSNWQTLGQPLIANGDGVNSVAFSPDGKMLAAGVVNAFVVLWSMDSRQLIGQLATTSTINSIAFSPDGDYLAIGSYNDPVTLWEIDIQTWVNSSCERAGRNLTQLEWHQFFPDKPYHLTCPQWPAGE